MPTTLETIIELQQALNELAVESSRLAQVPESMRELHEEHQQLGAEIARLGAEALEAEQERRAAEGSADAMQERIAHYQQQINLVTTQREYGALLSEIDTATKAKQEHEDAGLAALERHETATRECAEFEARYAEIDDQYQQELESWESEKPAVAAKVERIEGLVEVLKSRLAPPVLRRFELLYERHEGSALARIEKVDRPGNAPVIYRCSVCNYSVRPQVVVEIQSRGELVACDCGRQRIFYFDDAI